MKNSTSDPDRRFDPIAIVGLDILFPGVSSADELGQAIFEKRSLISSVPPSRWRVEPHRILLQPGMSERDRSRTDRGGYVSHFASRWNPARFQLPSSTFTSLDPSFLWAMELARGALADIGRPIPSSAKISAILGLLSFPSGEMARWCEHVWGTLPAGESAQPINRFASGLPALMIKEALGLQGEAFALDAACASSLYAIKLACDRLQDRLDDLVLAGAVNRADDLFIHVGFTALDALSPTGQSRPFHAEADGLVPSEGAGFVALCRYEDAVAEGYRIHGVIRGIGLSNDGRGRGLLAPSTSGQIRSMRSALNQAGCTPEDISFIECHATGTPVGDATELASLGEVYTRQESIPVGSIKSNLGHPITAAGMAGITKILQAFQRNQCPPTIHHGPKLDALYEGSLRLLEEAEPIRGPRRASLSAFGFGGNNAHLVLEAPEETGKTYHCRTPSTHRTTPSAAAVVGLALHAGPDTTTPDVLHQLREAPPAHPRTKAETVDLALPGLRFPPRDLESSLSQQKAIIAAIQDVDACQAIDWEQGITGVYVGMGCDPEVARWGARWRLPEEDPRREVLAPPLTAAAVLGTMPNMPANRLSNLLNLQGPSFTVSAEETSGLVAVELALRALTHREIDRAIVAAVDYSHEPVHQQSLVGLPHGSSKVPGDGVALLVLMRPEDAQSAGIATWGTLDLGAGSELPPIVAARYGHAHAAAALMEAAAHVLLNATHESTTASAGIVATENMCGHRHHIRLIPPEAGSPRPPHRSSAHRLVQPHLSHPAHPPTIRTAPGNSKLQEITPPMSDTEQPTIPNANLQGKTRLVRAPVLPATQSCPEYLRARPERPVGTELPVLEEPSTPGQPNNNGIVPANEPPLQDLVETTPTRPQQSGHPLELLMEQHQQIDALHQQFLRNQSLAQQRFLEIQQQALTQWAHATQGAAPTSSISNARPSQPSGRTPSLLGWQTSVSRASNGSHNQLSDLSATPGTHAQTINSYPEVNRKTPAYDRSQETISAPSKTPSATTRPHVKGRSVEPFARSAPQSDILQSGATTKAPTQNPTTEQSSPAPKQSLKTPTPSRSTPADLRPMPSPTPARRRPVGPCFNREQLIVHACGHISEIFGAPFSVQETYHRQVRMPEPPLLLADRVTGLDAQIGSMETGTIWTETDVTEDAWYLHEGHMPAGIMIEAGQADLMLISYLGADFENRGERIYRLLGCDLTYHGGLPEPKDILAYEIHVDGHAQQGPVRIFFFHYDGWINGERRISVRGGQAGFFTDKELSESKGILWSPEDETPEANARLDPPKVPSPARAFSQQEITAFAEGDGYRCFGDGYERLATHSRTPRISGGKMVFFDAVDTFDPQGGPWNLGYLKAHRRIRADDWFFEGHFKNDPCMPGTLMYEGTLQTMAFYMAAMGFTLNKDGFRFEPVPELTYRLRCRGQVTPQSTHLAYEVFVREIWDGDEPTLVADLLCTVDGLKAFHAQRVALRLVPSWPLDQLGQKALSAKPHPNGRAPVHVGDITLNQDAMLACAWGKPSRAFGQMYTPFDNARKVPRLPGPPYHFMSRVVSAPETAMGAFTAGVEIEVEYDIPPDAWYFAASNTQNMPFSVLLEAALQPCGWLASYIGSTLQVGEDLYFRNLDGTGTVLREVGPQDGILTTKLTLNRVAKTGAMIIVGFSVRCCLQDADVYTMETVFGFFPKAALASQVGLSVSEVQQTLRTRPSEQTYNLRQGELPPQHLSADRLCLLDRVTGWWPDSGEAGLGHIRAEMDVHPDQWFFAAHFFQDPVQPGSLGLEVMLDTLRAAALLRMGSNISAEGRFEVLAVDHPLQWKYRGQVLPENKKVEVSLELTDDQKVTSGRLFVARGSLWVDGTRIYEANGLSIRWQTQADRAPHPVPQPTTSSSTADRQAELQPVKPDITANEPPRQSWHFDEATSPWLNHHQPTWTLAAVPMMVLLDALVELAGPPPIRLENVRLRGWVVVDRPRTLTGHKDGAHVRLEDESGVTIIDAQVSSTHPPPETMSPLIDGHQQPNPYENGRLFHGPAFQILQTWMLGDNGAQGLIVRPKTPAQDQDIPRGVVDPLLLDAGLHTIPHDQLELWTSDIRRNHVAYPARIDHVHIYGAAPYQATVETRFIGCLSGPQFPQFHLQWYRPDGSLWVDMHLTEASFPKGPIGCAQPAHRRAFITGHYTPKVSLSRREEDTTILDTRHIPLSDWLPGTIAAVYGTTEPETIAIHEHRSQIHGLHPKNIDLQLPCTYDAVELKCVGPLIQVRSTAPQQLDLQQIESFWTDWFKRPAWLGEDLYYSLLRRFIGRVVLTHPEAFAALRERSVLFLANHQTMIESLLFSILASGLIKKPTVTVAKAEHRTSWLGTLIKHCFAHPGIADPEVITFFDRDDRASLAGVITKLASQLASNHKAVMVHVEGTRALHENHRLQKMSGAFLDLAIQTQVPVVPVWFAGGLPEEPLPSRIDFPNGMGKQDLWLGRPFSPEELATLPYGPRKTAVISAINDLGDAAKRGAQTSFVSDPIFQENVRTRMSRTGIEEADAVMMEVLLETPKPRAETTTRLTEAARAGHQLSLSSSPEDQWLAKLAKRFIGY
ncbi:MAG: 1-acyl-sn-glycerol-3-phosphate acyltransferase [Myxococcales bacterium]|nr:1-acyl-sn-glycerol-3-phosphate acyltransferase [Myxococcales bacterium]